MVLEWMQKVDVLEYYSDVNVASASEVFPLPAVMRCRAYVQRPRRRGRMLVSKRNILLRDRHMCQCGPAPASAVHLRAPTRRCSNQPCRLHCQRCVCHACAAPPVRRAQLLPAASQT